MQVILTTIIINMLWFFIREVIIENLSNKRKEKMDLFKTLLSNDNTKNYDNYVAYHLIDIVFSNDKKVINTCHKYYESLSLEHLIYSRITTTNGVTVGISVKPIGLGESYTQEEVDEFGEQLEKIRKCYKNLMHEMARAVGYNNKKGEEFELYIIDNKHDYSYIDKILPKELRMRAELER